ncbi:MAG: MFS transporter, partial [bacterium]
MFELILYLTGFLFCTYVIYLVFDYVKSLRKSPRELWLLMGSQVFEITAYTVVDFTLVLFLSYDMGLSDMAAGNFVGTWTTATVIITFFIGTLVDATGVRRILLTGTVITLVSRIFLAFFHNYWLLVILSFMPMAVSLAMLGPVIAVAVKQYTTEKTSIMGFGLYMTIMNVMTAVAAHLFDTIRELSSGGKIEIPFTGEVSAYRTELIVAAIITLPSFVFILFLRRSVFMQDDSKIIIKNENSDKQDGWLGKIMIQTTVDSFKRAAGIFKEVISQPLFWRFMLLITLLFGVKFVFFHFVYTFPKYGIRILGENAPVGTLFGTLHAVLITILLPAITSWTKKVRPYSMITIGTFVSAFSVFMLSLPEQYFIPLSKTSFGTLIIEKWLGISEAGPTVSALYVMIVLTVAIFTVGEAMWAPRIM